MGNNKSTVTGRYILLVGIGSFFLAVVFTFFSETITSRLDSILVSTVFLIIIIFINVLADLIGTAVTTASHIPFNAKSAKKIKGAPQGLRLIRNADKVANICNDVIGDITTTVGGALGISIVIQVMQLDPQLSQFWLNILVTAIIASVIVSGKATGKKIALSRPDDVIFIAGRIVAYLEDIASINPLKKGNVPKNRKGV
ncbi:MAG: hypothetical protein GX949_05955 [Peptococcaceae bacterium]|nr:hypothetical protein [Peptococcaceae bacterium]